MESWYYEESTIARRKPKADNQIVKRATSDNLNGQDTAGSMKASASVEIASRHERAAGASSSYQRRKARLIAAVLIQATAQSDVPMTQLAQLAARMDHRQWVTVSLQAGVAVADHPAKVLTVAYLMQLS